MASTDLSRLFDRINAIEEKLDLLIAEPKPAKQARLLAEEEPA